MEVSGDKVKASAIDTPWTVEFKPARSDVTFTKRMTKLTDFTKSKSTRIKNFSGTATYKTTFNVKDTSYARLDLGWDNDFISEVQLNGVKLGVNWYGTKLFDTGKALKKGPNKLTIRYTTTLWNHMKKKQLQPTGLIGPVRLVN
jgi:hypothetical protein